MQGPEQDPWTFELTNQRVELWPIRVTGRDGAALFQRVLSSDEAERAARFRFEHLRHFFTLSRGALRVLLGRYLGVPASRLQFTYGSNGKPSLAASVPVKFNVSHSGDLTLFAFTLGCEVGVDVEQVRRIPEMEEIATRFFSTEEAAELLALPAHERERAFFRCWTRKEAYIKAIGEGLSAPLDEFRVTLGPGEPARFIHFRQDTTAASSWTLHDLDLECPYAAALAYRGAPRQIRILPSREPATLVSLM